METIYYTIDRTIKPREENKIIDLADYRRRMEAKAGKANGTYNVSGISYEEVWEEEPVSAPEKGPAAPRRWSGHVWTLDVCASLSVVIMTLACTLRVLLG